MSISDLSPEQVSVHDVLTTSARRRPAAGIALLVTAVLCLLVLGTTLGVGDRARFRLTDPGVIFALPLINVPATGAIIVLSVLVGGFGVLVLARPLPRGVDRVVIGLAGLGAVLAFLVWVCTGTTSTVLDLSGLLATTVFLAIPLILGSLAGVVSERSGVINVAIEGQMLAGAFMAAVVGTATGSLLFGAVGGAVMGVAFGAILAVFAIRYLVNQVVLGVVINLLVLGLTSFLYSQLLQAYSNSLNQPDVFQPIPIPFLADIPVLGPVFFRGNVLVYVTYLLVIFVQVALFRTRWGLRTRAVGEHPQAADTVGINVNRLRFRNSLGAGAIAGLAGAYISIGSVGAFGANMSAGRGFIALAAVIFGRWTPLGSLGACLLFAFCSALQTLLSIVGSPVQVPSQFLAMLPYLATIVVVAGVVGRVNAPAADGIPYVKQ